MPIYEYFCSQCEEIHEALVAQNSEEVAKCPVCGQELEKLLSSPNIIIH